MPTQKKIEEVAQMEEKLKRSTIVISTEFRGVTVAQINELRRQLRAQGVDYMVVKNTLVGIAADNTGRGKLREVLKGPTAIVLGYNEPGPPAKAIMDFVRTARVGITVNGGILEGQMLTPHDVQRLATLPSKSVLMGQLMGNMLAPLSGLVYSLNFHVSGLARVLEGRRKQLEQASIPQAAA